VSVFDIVVAATISSAVKRSGAYSLHVADYSRHAGAYLPASTELYLRLGVYPTGGTAERVFLSLGDGSWCQLQFYTPSGGFAPIRVNRGIHRETFLAEGGILAAPAWNCVEVYAKIHPSEGRVSVKVDGVEVIDFTGNTKGSGTYIDRFFVGANPYGGSVDKQKTLWGYYDDIAVNNTTGTEHNSWPGVGGIFPVLVDGAGSHAEFTPSAGDNYACVDERPPNDDTDYVESDIVGTKDAYSIDASGLPSGLVTAVQWVARGKLSIAGYGALAPLLRHGGVNYEGTPQGLGVSYAMSQVIFEQAPDATPWTVAKVTALEAGAVVR